MLTGEYYEEQAAQLLLRNGLQVLERNFTCKAGEIDIVCCAGELLIFVEVRYRYNPRYASAAASVTRAKQHRIIRTAQYFLQRRGWQNTRPCRFDVIAFSPSQAHRADGTQWIQNAFTM